MKTKTPPDPRLTQQSLRILNVFLADATRELAGADLFDATGMMSGTLYPILIRFEDAGWLKSRWETADPAKMGRPRRRLYRMTPLGQRRASAALAELTAGVRA